MTVQMVSSHTHIYIRSLVKVIVPVYWIVTLLLLFVSQRSCRQKCFMQAATYSLPYSHLYRYYRQSMSTNCLLYSHLYNYYRQSKNTN